MSILEKLNETLDKMNQFEGLETANHFIDSLKKNFRQRLGGNFLKVDFDKSDNNNGVVFIRFAKAPYTEACNEKFKESPVNFIISVEGFDGEGGLCEDCGCFTVETLQYNDPDNRARKLKRRQLCDINMVEQYLTKYVERYQDNLRDDYEECSENTGTSSGAGPTAGSGSDLTIGGGAPDNSHGGNIAVFKKKLGSGEVEKRKKRKVYGS
jgi:hypothetical protein